MWRTAMCVRRGLGAVASLTAILATSVMAMAAEKPAPSAAPAPAPLDPQHAQKMAKGLEIFKSDVRQQLVEHCLACHGGEKVKADFNLATREDLLKGGEDGAAIVPGDAKKSWMYKLITHEEEPHMPQKAPKLSPAAIAKIEEWINLGAPYDKPLTDKKIDAKAPKIVTAKDREFWSFQPLKRVEPVAEATDKWSRSPIDRFIFSQLKAKGLAPNPIAKKEVLIRRAYLDLVGMPPTPAELEAFLNDSDPKAYEKVIDKLLDDPRYGERWGRHWLDVARFAESHGFEQDYDRPHAYHYRDFVIKALNSDMPFDQFVRWQIAGDEFEPANPLAMMATGFLGAGVFPTQLTEKEFESARYDELDDMAATTSSAFLGLTLGCARCHDHKFDPIPVVDYYRFVSTFATTIRSNIDLELDSDKVKPALAAWEAKHAPLAAELATFEKEQLPVRFEAWAKEQIAKGIDPAKAAAVWTVLDVDAKSHQGTTFQKQGDGSVLATGKNPPHDKWTFTARTTQKGITAVRLEAMAHPSFVKGGPGRAGNGNFSLSVFKVSARPAGDAKAKAVPAKLATAKATFEQNNSSLSIASSIDGDNVSGWAVDPQFGKDHAAVFEFESPIGFDGGTELTFDFEYNNNTQHSIGRPRLSISTAPRPVPLTGNAAQQQVVELLGALAKAGDTAKLDAKQKDSLQAFYKGQDGEWAKLNAKVQQSLAARPRPQATKVMVTSEGVKPIPHHADGRGFPHFYKDVYQLNRGDVHQKKEIATQGFMQVVMAPGVTEKKWQTAAPPTGARTSHRRSALANWIVDADGGAGNLAARVIVNRLWQHHLGRGIVNTPNDFGFQGDRPSHPQLLDYLATELIRGGWKLKPLHKLIMTSSVYMQGSDHNSAGMAVDPQNTLYWRSSFRRLEGEAIRDSMLFISGQLDQSMYGPGTLDEGMKRRSVYFFIKRSKLIPVMMLFDQPEPLVSQGTRPSTTIAPQALLFMNSKHVRGYAEGFAGRLVAEKTLVDAVAQAYLIAVSRKPTAQETADNVAFIEGQIAAYDAQKKGNAKQLALADFCQVVMSLNEFIYVE